MAKQMLAVALVALGVPVCGSGVGAISLIGFMFKAEKDGGA